MAMVTILVIVAAVACCGLCAYGISTAIHRARARRDQQALTPTQR